MDEKNYIQSIKEEYTEHTPDDMDKLIALDKKARLPAIVFAYSFGIIGSLVLGIGMCLAMKIIGDLMPLGIVVGVVGIAMVSANYFIYKAILKSRKKKFADEILALSDKIVNE